ncbi:TPA: hypothetical protein ACGW44_005436, partial [Bacillus toyonensis]
SNTESSYPTGTTESPYYPSNTESSYPNLDTKLFLDKKQLGSYQEKTKNIFEHVNHLTIHQYIYPKTSKD